MNRSIITNAKPALQGLAKGLGRAAAVASMVLTFGAFCVGSIPSGAVLIGVSGLAITAVTATTAHAACLIGGVLREDILEDDCLEAQRTGCVRRLLNKEQYTNCLAANKPFKGKRCVIDGKVRGDLSEQDCEEAKATGCVRGLLSKKQYENCLNAQPN